MFRSKYPIAWTFHRNTSRWPFNTHEVPVKRSPEAPFKEDFNASTRLLPQVELPAVPLRNAILARFSCRRFRDAPLKTQEVSALLKAAYGINQRTILGGMEFLERPVPSGGGLYPLELYLLVRNVEEIEQGIYHYVPLYHAIEQVRSIQLPRYFISNLFMGQIYVAEASVIIVVAAVLERSLWKYGDRGYRYILLEAGHVAQNLNLVSCAAGIGSLNLGGFFDSDMANLLNLDIEEEIPLYAVALGMPSSDDRSELRHHLGD